MQEKFHEAIHFINKALKFSIENPEYWLALAISEYKVGNLVSAQDAFAEASELRPGNAEIWLEWSWMYYEQGDYGRAIELILSGIEECPEDSNLYYRITAYLIADGKYKQAFNFLENALVLDFENHTVCLSFSPNSKRKGTVQNHRPIQKKELQMNYELSNLPARTEKPRQEGFTMAMDKGLSLREVEDFIEVAGAHTDIVKLGWATSYVTPNLKEKIKLYIRPTYRFIWEELYLKLSSSGTSWMITAKSWISMNWNTPRFPMAPLKLSMIGSVR